MSADEAPKTPDAPRPFPLGIAMHNALYDASVPTEPPASGGSVEPSEPDYNTFGKPAADLDAETLAVLVKIETAARHCEYGVGIPGFGLAQCGLPAHAMITNHPCEHGSLACEAHVRTIVDAISEGDITLICVQCVPKTKVTHVVWSRVGEP